MGMRATQLCGIYMQDTASVTSESDPDQYNGNIRWP